MRTILFIFVILCLGLFIAVFGSNPVGQNPRGGFDIEPVGRNPRGADIESLVGRGSDAPKAQRNPTLANPQAEETIPGGPPLAVGSERLNAESQKRQTRASAAHKDQIIPPLPADTGCYLLRGDMDHSGAHDIADLTYTVGYLFGGGPPPVCAEEGDVDASGELDISDLTYFVGYLFLGGPAPPIPQGKDYVVYYFNGGNINRQMHAYHVLTHQLDTVTTGWDPGGDMVLSPDGNTLYLVNSDGLFVINTQTWQASDTLTYAYIKDLAVSPDGHLLAVMGYDLTILNTSDFTVAYEDTSDIIDHGVFSSDSRSFFGAVYNSVLGRHYYRVNLDSLTVTRMWVDSAKAFKILPSLDETKWFLYVVFGGAPYYSFKVYDVASDSIIFHDPVTPGVGYLAMTPDGKRVVYTNPGNMNIENPQPPSEFKIFDVDNNRIDTVINTALWDCGPSPGYYPVGQIAITPDGNWLVGAYAQQLTGPFLLNLNTYQMEDCIFVPGGDIAPAYLTVQTIP